MVSHSKHQQCDDEVNDASHDVVWFSVAHGLSPISLSFARTGPVRIFVLGLFGAAPGSALGVRASRSFR